MLVYLNGAFLPPGEACISPLDRGFLFGDGVYEVIPSYRGAFFLLDEHLERLGRSLAGIRIAEPRPEEGWSRLLERLLERNPGGDRSVYLQVSRGVAPRDHAFPAGATPTVFAMVSPIVPTRPDPAEAGIGAITLPDQRWGRCDIKSIALLANVLARQQAVDSGAVEAILLRDGVVTEGAASNVFVVHGEIVSTPPLGHSILPGITRRFLVDTLREAGWDCRETPVSGEALRSADEIWVTSSTREVVPVTTLDGHPVGGGRGCPVWQRALGIFRRTRDRSIGATETGANQ